jgi:hypothetical protein
MTKRRRSGARIGAGLLLAASPLIIGQQAAGGAVTEAEDEAILEFVDYDGVLNECRSVLAASHNTNDPNHPELLVGLGLAVISGPSCFDVGSTIEATYKDDDGVRRSALVGGDFLQLDGAYSEISVSLTARYTQCDPVHELPCEVELHAAPK